MSEKTIRCIYGSCINDVQIAHFDSLKTFHRFRKAYKKLYPAKFNAVYDYVEEEPLYTLETVDQLIKRCESELDPVYENYN